MFSFERYFSAVALVALFATASVAQPAPQGAGAPPPQPSGQKPQFWGLFGGGSKDQPHSLDLNAAVSGVYDDNLGSQLPNNPSSQGFNVDPRTLKAGYGQSASASLSYGFSKGGRRDSVTASGSASVQEFGGAIGNTLWFHQYGATAGYRHDITPKITFSLGGGSAYAPFYRYAPFLQDTLNDVSPAGQDYGFTSQAEMVRTTTASAAIEDRFSRRSSISFGATWDRQDVPDDPEVGFERRGVRTTFSHNLLKKLAFHVSYGVEQLKPLTSDLDPNFNQMMDVGLGYGDGLTVKLGRYTTLTMSVGTGLMRNGDPQSVVRTGKSTAFTINGNATLSRSIGRTWGASIGYRQGTSYMVGFSEPVFTENAFVGLGGPIFQRLQFSAGGGASRGEQVFSSGSSLTAYNASAKLTFAVWSNLGFYSQVSYYRYSIPFDYQLDFTPKLERRSASVGLTTWLPLIKRPRAPRGEMPAAVEQP